MTDLAAKTLASIDERWRSLTIANDFVFCKAMLDADLCREVLEAILGVSIERVEYVGRQETLDAGAESKSVRLDVYVRDEKGTVYNVEMQSSDTRELPQRARYYHSLLTCNQLRHGSSYKDLKDVYVIFICSFDLFAQGRRVYSFENRCEGLESLMLGDGSKAIFLAADAPASNGFGARVDELLDYVPSGRVTGELSARLAAAVADVLDNEKWRLEFMMLEVRDQLNSIAEKSWAASLVSLRAVRLASPRASSRDMRRVSPRASNRAAKPVSPRASSRAARLAWRRGKSVARNALPSCSRLSLTMDARTRLPRCYATPLRANRSIATTISSNCLT